MTARGQLAIPLRRRIALVTAATAFLGASTLTTTPTSLTATPVAVAETASDTVGVNDPGADLSPNDLAVPSLQAAADESVSIFALPGDDDDGDGIQNQYEDANTDLDDDADTNPGPDTDGDTIPDYLDPDDDGDGIATLAENADPNTDGDPRDALDTDRDGQPDYLDVEAGPSSTPVATEQKISDLVGGLAATLDDSDSFGTSVASIGDLDGDGMVDLAVGAYLDDDGGTDRGAAYILFLNADGTVKAEQKLSSSTGGLTGPLDDSDFFGTSVAGIGDLDGDGTPDVAIGSPRDDDGGANRGAIYVLFMNTDGTVKAEQKISSSTGGLAGPLDNSDLFGFSLAGIGDVDGDGTGDITVGAQRDDDGGSGRGAVYVLFLNTNGTVKTEQKISDTTGGLAATLDNDDYFGSTMAGLGDVDGDGINDVAVGADLDDDGGIDQGATYILLLNSNGTVKAEQKISATTGGLTGPLDSFDSFGSVAGLGDLDGDGALNLAIGAYGDDDGGPDRGAVYILDLTAANVVVNSTGDASDQNVGNGICETSTPGECTLRAAIEEANASPNIHTIEFDIATSDPGHVAGQWTIAPPAPLPQFTQTVHIDGTTQPGHTPATTSFPDPLDSILAIRIDGSLAGTGEAGLSFGLGADDSRLRGLSITGFEGSGGSAVQIDGADRVLIAGNHLGMGGDGTTVGVNAVGVDIVGLGGVGTRVGGSAPADRNMISGNDYAGVALNGPNAIDTIIQGNEIGPTGAGVAGASFGVVAFDGASGALIGGPGAGQGNRITGADTAVLFDSNPADSFGAVVSNRIWSNTGAGLDNLFDGHTANDPGDTDTGPNDLLNHPVITAATVSGGTVTLTYDLDVPAHAEQYRVEFFTNPSGADAYGEGEQLASSVVTSPGSALVHSFAATPGDKITAMVTRINSAAAHGFDRSSEFSATAIACGDADSDGLWDCEEDWDRDADEDPATDPGPDTDGDALPNYLDADDDGDGAPTSVENADPNTDGDPRDALDTDYDGQPDYLDVATRTAAPWVITETKIGNGAGGLSATLDNDDTFGYDTTAIGDLDGDGIVDLAVGALSDDDGGTDRGAVYVLFLNADGTVKAEQKISDTAGGFLTPLDDGDAFGSSVATIGDLDGDGIVELAIGARSDDDGGSDRGAVYVLFLNADGTVKGEQKISASSGGLQASGLMWFGNRSAEIGDLDGDGTPDLAVGANRSGGVFVLFLNSDGTVRDEQEISTGVGGLTANVGWFGTDLSSLGDLDGDGTTDLIVGDITDDDGGPNRGAAYVLFMNVDGTVRAEQKISDTAGGLGAALANDANFGSAVATLGDVYGTGSTVVAVGASYSNRGGTADGAVYLLALDVDGTVMSTDEISAVAGGFQNPLGDYFEFGSSVSAIGDLDGDGTVGLAIGAYGDNDGIGWYQGAVYVVDFATTACRTDSDTDGLWDCEEDANTDLDGDPTTNPGPDTDSDALPNYLDPDDDNDGTPTASENADPNTDGDPRDALDTDYDGQPDYLDRPTSASTLPIAAEQKISDLTGGLTAALDNADGFGASAASIGDIDGDGTVDIAVGAPFDDDGGFDRGAIYVMFLNPDGTIRAEQKISDLTGGLAATLDNGDQFGRSVASIGDLDGDGIGDLAVGAHFDDDGGLDRGAIYVLLLHADGTVRAELKISSSAGGLIGPLDDGDEFGYGVAGIGDVDGDGTNDIAVGAILDDDGGLDRGAIYVLFLNPDGSVKAEQKISDTTGGLVISLDQNDWFGVSVAGIGDIDGDGFTDVAVGAYSDDDGGLDHGAIYVLFLNPDGTVNAEQKISDTQGNLTTALGNLDGFGWSVSAAGDLDGDGVSDIAVGAYGDDDGSTDRGAAYILFLNANGTVRDEQKISSTQGGLTGPLDTFDGFGTAVAGVGDLDTDGSINLVIGAISDDDGGTDRGAVYVVDLSRLTTLTVNSTADSPDNNIGNGTCDTGATNSQGAPECTLRAALAEAAATALIDTINFDIPTTEAGYSASPERFTIQPTSSLPAVISALTINGESQPQALTNSRPVIELDGSLAGASNGLVVSGADAVIRYLTINRFGSSLADEGLYITGDRVLVEYNRIGTDVTAAAALPNAGDGISVGGGADVVLANNIVSGNAGHGISVTLSSTNTVITGNRVGVEGNGTSPLANGSSGVSIDSTSTGARIGGTTGGDANVIAYNTLRGVALATGATAAILGNLIHSNGLMGIDLNTNGLTLNDVGDADSGANDLLNFPVISAAGVTGATLTIDYSLDVPAGTYRIEMFTNPSGADGTGHGEGEVWELADTIVHTGSGPEVFQIVTTGALGQVISMTATTDLGGGVYGVTSEFSQTITSAATDTDGDGLADSVEDANSDVDNDPSTNPGPDTDGDLIPDYLDNDGYACGSAQSEIPSDQCRILTAFYQATGGATWTYSTNWLTGSTPSNWFGVIVSGGNVTELALPANNVAGPIPPVLGSLVTLTGLDLSGNALTGGVPVELGGLTSLTSLDLGDNDLAGALPTELGDLVALVDLWLGSNQFTGGIPVEITTIAGLQTLDVGDNLLSGPLPTQLGNLADLRYLDVSDNSFTGTVPAALGTPPLLDDLHLANNSFGGLFPTAIMTGAAPATLTLSGNQCLYAVNAIVDEWLDARDATWQAACPDTDGDGLYDLHEDANTDLDYNPATNPGPDSDGDTNPDYLDADDDNDGSPTSTEGADPDGDGAPWDALDSDRDGEPDYLDGPTVATIGAVTANASVDSLTPALFLVGDGDTFATSLTSIGDVDGDGINDMAAGAPLDDMTGTDQGAIYVLFMNSNGTVRASQRIGTGSGGLTATISDFDHFGTSIAGMGDVNGDGTPDIAVGAADDDTGGSDRGAIYVLLLNSNGTVAGETKIASSLGGLTALANGDRFGASVAGLGDHNNDGITDIVVGAPSDDEDALDAGALYALMLNPDGTVQSQQKINGTNTGLPTGLASGDNFGVSVANIGDVDGDGSNDIAAGADLSDDGIGGTDFGKVYVLRLAPGGAVQSQTEIGALSGGLIMQPASGDRFGRSVAAVGDLDRDGTVDVIIGSPGSDNGGTDRGALVIVSLNSDGSVAQERTISSTTGGFSLPISNQDEFGTSMTNLGDLDGNGVTTIVVGSPGNDAGGPDRGAMSVISLRPRLDSDGDGLFNDTEDHNLDRDANPATNPGPDTDADLTVDYLDADNDGDGIPTASENADPNSDGRAQDALDSDGDGQPDYLDDPTGATVALADEVATLSDLTAGFAGSGIDDARLGRSVTAVGDVNGDGTVDVVIGAPYIDDGGAGRGGIIVVFIDSNGAPLGEQRISSTGGGFTRPLDDNDQFGTSVTSLGDLDGDGTVDIAVGAPGDDDGGTDRGAFYVLLLNPDGTVKANDKVSQVSGGFDGSLNNVDLFGASVANIGDVDGDGTVDLAVGAIGDDDGGTDRGAVWTILLRRDGTTRSSHKFSTFSTGFVPPIADGDSFGAAITGLGDVDGDGVGDMLVGAPGRDDGGIDAGAAHLLFLNPDGSAHGGALLSATSGSLPIVPQAGDGFGSSVSIVGDLNLDGVVDLVIGSPGRDDGSPEAGAISIVSMTTAGVVTAQNTMSLAAGGLGPVINAGDGFGSSVAPLGDLNGDGSLDVVVGAVGVDDGGPNRGAVFVVSLVPQVDTDGDGIYDAIEDADTDGDDNPSSNPGPDTDGDGTANYLDPDDDNDGRATAIENADSNGDGLVADARDTDRDGQPDYLDPATVPSSALVSTEAKISNTSGGLIGPVAINAEFGSAMAPIGDINNDGVLDIAVGAPALGAGEVRVLLLNSNGSVASEFGFDSSHPALAGLIEPGDEFGAAVSSVSDLDGDGVMDLIVSAPGDDDGGPNRGAIYVLWMNADGSLRAVSKISDVTGGLAAVLADNAAFGSAVSTLADLDGDGRREIAVGLPNDDAGGPGRGAVTVLFMNPDGSVRDEQRISDTEGGFSAGLTDGDNFGFGVSGIGDIDSDGVADLAVVAPGDDTFGANYGAFYVLLLNADGTVKTSAHLPNGTAGFVVPVSDGLNVGGSVAGIGDFDRDGVNDLAIGWGSADVGGTDRGAVFVVLLNTNGTAREVGELSDLVGNVTGPLDDGDQFGASIAGLGDFDGNGSIDLLVGASSDDDGATDSGAVYILNTATLVGADRDFDGIRDIFELALDLDGDGLNNVNDPDDDGDGFPTITENADPDFDGDPADALDTDGDGTPDYLDNEGFPCADGQSEIPVIQCRALLDFYNQTNGPSWGLDTGWLNDSTPSTWLGVTVSGGQVTGLSLPGNNLTGTLPTTIGALGSLNTLTLTNNAIGGTIPPAITSLTSLQVLRLGTNNFTGSIPTQVGNLVNLQVLRLAENNLTGPIPASVGNLVALDTFDASLNTLSGALPTELGLLATLQELRLNTNQFSGSVPPEIGDMVGLVTLDLNNNLLDGLLPPELSNLTSANLIHLHNNRFHGVVPGALSLIAIPANLLVESSLCLVPADALIWAQLDATDPAWQSGCIDTDNDGVPDYFEDLNADLDFDPSTNPGPDSDGDLIANYLDVDDDGDTINTPFEGPDANGDLNPDDSLDTDADTAPNYVDFDDDNDGLSTSVEAPDPNNDNNPSDGLDTDGDGLINAHDPDDDNDAIPTSAEGADPNGDFLSADALDNDFDGQPNYLDANNVSVASSFTVKDTRIISVDTGNLGPDLSDGDAFGTGLVAIGDIDGNGVTDLAVGAPGDDDGGPGLGAVHILFLDIDGSVLSQTRLSSSSVPPAIAAALVGRFGTSVAAMGDMNGDTIGDIAIGEPGGDTSWLLYLDRDGSILGGVGLSGQLLTDLPPGWDGQLDYGTSITSPGDIDGDGSRDIYTGLPRFGTATTTEIGAVASTAILAALSGVGLETIIYEGVSNFSVGLTNGDRLSQVHTAGDIDGNGVNDIIVAAPTANGLAGRAWLLLLDNSFTIIGVTELTGTAALNPAAGDEAGFGGAPLGDLNADGIDDFAVVSPGGDAGVADGGSVSLWRPGPLGSVTVDTLDASSRRLASVLSAGDRISSITSLGDLNGDGVGDIAIGLPGYDDAGTERGAVVIVFLDADTDGDGVQDSDEDNNADLDNNPSTNPGPDSDSDGTPDYLDANSAPFAGCDFQGQMSSQDCQTLLALFVATGGTSWLDNTGWGTSGLPCDWAGVTCTSNRVSGIDLDGNNLTGSLPANLSTLAALTTLRLDNNNLSGAVPTWLGSMTNVDELGLADNNFVGQMPSSIVNLPGGIYFALSGNQCLWTVDPTVQTTLNSRDPAWQSGCNGDLDGDTISDITDGFTDPDGDGLPNHQDPDSDGDGIADIIEAGPSGGPIDTDGDGLPDHLDTDTDNDGIADAIEGSIDRDADGIGNWRDPDSDGDGIADATEGNSDPDNDGIANFLDTDDDGDGIPDNIDGTADIDNDGAPNYLDTDSDGDGLTDVIEVGSNPTNPPDTDNDGTDDFVDTDSDGDTIPDALEAAATLGGAAIQVNTDGDSLPDWRDTDSDNDGISDLIEAGPVGSSPRDSDRDGTPDYRDIDDDNDTVPTNLELPSTRDTDGDGRPNYLDDDDDNDNVPTRNEMPTSLDQDDDGIADYLDPTNDDGPVTPPTPPTSGPTTTTPTGPPGPTTTGPPQTTTTIPDGLGRTETTTTPGVTVDLDPIDPDAVGPDAGGPDTGGSDAGDPDERPGPPNRTAAGTTDDSVRAVRGVALLISVLDNDSIASRGSASIEVDQPDIGRVEVDADGTVTYWPPPDYVGPASFSYRVTDADGNVAQAMVWIDVRLPPLSAQAESLSVVQAAAPAPVEAASPPAIELSTVFLALLQTIDDVQVPLSLLALSVLWVVLLIIAMSVFAPKNDIRYLEASSSARIELTDRDGIPIGFTIAGGADTVWDTGRRRGRGPSRRALVDIGATRGWIPEHYLSSDGTAEGYLDGLSADSR